MSRLLSSLLSLRSTTQSFPFLISVYPVKYTQLLCAPLVFMSARQTNRRIKRRHTTTTTKTTMTERGREIAQRINSFFLIFYILSFMLVLGSATANIYTKMRFNCLARTPFHSYFNSLSHQHSTLRRVLIVERFHLR